MDVCPQTFQIATPPTVLKLGTHSLCVPLPKKLELIFEILILKFFCEFFFKFQIWTVSGTAAAELYR